MGTGNVYSNRKTTDILPRHDLYFGSPQHDPTSGLPIGDGDTGSLIWVSEDAVHVNINKTDLWDESVSAKDSPACSGVTEDLTALRHGGELTLTFPAPVFHLFYQKDFEARLSLKDATASIRSRTPFSDFFLSAFASAEEHVTVFDFSMRTAEPMDAALNLSRWGSRTFWRWYAQIQPGAESGLSGTDTDVFGGCVFITQQLHGTVFCIGIRTETEECVPAETVSTRSGRILFPRSCEHKGRVYLHISVGKDGQTVRKDCERVLERAATIGKDKLYECHRQSWAGFWNKSFLHIPNDYAENIYYLSLYFSNSECRGAYPPHFTNGIWGFQHDYLPWNYYFHYNMQHMYAPLDAAGHGDLCEGYYRMRRQHLDRSIERAKKEFGVDGAYYHDVTDKDGKGADYDSLNMTPASQIALAMWNHYRFTGDEEFLKDIALPVLKGATDLYLGLFSRGDDGLYHIKHTTAYEGNVPTNDTVTDLVMARALLRVTADLSKPPYKDRCLDLLDHLPFPTQVRMDELDLENGRLTGGIGKGKIPLRGGAIWAMGLDDGGKPVRRTFADPAREPYGFPEVELSAVYPSGLVGLKDAGTEVFDIMQNQIDMHPGHDRCCMHWCMMPIYLARMGQSERLRKYLDKFISDWQIYPNGFNVDGPGEVENSVNIRTYYHPVNLATDQKEKCLAFPFRHLNMESVPIVATAVSEMLLQSYDGIIRVCPAVEAEACVTFRLFAQGGFIVEAEVGSGRYRILVRSLRGETLRLKLPPFSDPSLLHVFTLDGGRRKEIRTSLVRHGTEQVWETGTEAGGVLLWTDDPADEADPFPAFEPAKPNAEMKSCGKAELGSPAVIQ